METLCAKAKTLSQRDFQKAFSAASSFSKRALKWDGGLNYQRPSRRVKSLGDKTGQEALNNLNREEAGKSLKQKQRKQKGLAFYLCPAASRAGGGRGSPGGAGATRCGGPAGQGAGVVAPGPTLFRPSRAPALLGNLHLRSRNRPEMWPRDRAKRARLGPGPEGRRGAAEVGIPQAGCFTRPCVTTAHAEGHAALQTAPDTQPAPAPRPV